MKNLNLSVALIGIFTISLMQTSHVSQAQDALFTVNVSLSNSQVMVGQPLYIHYVVNITDKLKQIYLHDRGNPGSYAWLELYDSDHHLIASEEKIQPQSGSFAMLTGVDKQHPFELNYIVNRKLLPKRPGNYILKVHNNWEYNYSDMSHVRLSTTTNEVPFRATRPDRVRLMKIADNLQRQIRDGKDSYQSIRVIMSMPERVALPFWREMAHMPSVMQLSGLYSKELQYIG